MGLQYRSLVRELEMSHRVLLGMAFALGALSATACGQAGAESALTHAGVASGVSSGASHLGDTLKQANKKLSDRVQRSVAPSTQNRSQAPAPAAPRSSSSAATASSSAPATASSSSARPTIITISGGTVPCDKPIGTQGAAEQAKTGSESTPANCKSERTPTPKRDQNTYKSVINLSSAK